MLVEVPCPICGSQRSKELFCVKDYTFAVSDYEFGVRRCLACGCGYLSPRPKEEDMLDYYADSYYWSYEREELSWEELIQVRRKQLEAKAAWLKDLPPGRLLDIGAQKGEFLWFMKERGWNVEGVEFNSRIPNPSGMNIRYGDFLDMGFKEEYYDCITMWAVLEHVYHPREYVIKIGRLLRRGGYFIGLVTNFNSIQGRILKLDDYPRHLNFFTKRSIKKLLKDFGFCLKIIKTDQKIFGGHLDGWLVYLIKRIGGYSEEEVLREWRSQDGPFYLQWKGRASALVLNISRFDHLVSRAIEQLLDRLGFGFILIFKARKV